MKRFFIVLLICFVSINCLAQGIKYDGYYRNIVIKLLKNSYVTGGGMPACNTQDRNEVERNKPKFRVNTSCQRDLDIQEAIYGAWGVEYNFRCNNKEGLLMFLDMMVKNLNNALQLCSGHGSVGGLDCYTTKIYSCSESVLPEVNTMEQEAVGNIGSGSNNGGGNSIDGGSSNQNDGNEAVSNTNNNTNNNGPTKQSLIDKKNAERKSRENEKQKLHTKIDINTKKIKPTSKKCIDLNESTYFIGTPLSNTLSQHSLNSAQRWSEWVKIDGTTLEIRFSKKSKCKSIEKMASGISATDNIGNLNIVNSMTDDAFDYGFYQLKNTGSSTVDGKFAYSSLDEYNKPNEGQEPFFLKPGETGKEEIGNWYIGCELTEIKLLKYCESN